MLTLTRLQEETAKVEDTLLASSDFSDAIINCFLNSKADSFENFLEPLQKLLRLSPPIAHSLAHPDLLSRTVLKLQSKKALVRLNLLRIIRSICDASDEDGALISTYGLYDSIADLAKHDQAILVREMAGDLLKSSEINARRIMDGQKSRQLRRSSSSTMTPILPSPGTSLPPTPGSDRMGRAGSYFDLTAELTRARPVATSSPYRPVSRDGNSGGSSAAANWSGGGITGVQKSRLPRTSAANRAHGRLSLAPKTENVTPTHASAQTRQNSGSGSVAVNARRRRQTSGG